MPPRCTFTRVTVADDWIGPRVDVTDAIWQRFFLKGVLEKQTIWRVNLGMMPKFTSITTPMQESKVKCLHRFHIYCLLTPFRSLANVDSDKIEGA